MTRVCIVTPDLAGPTRNGGIGTHCLHLARFLSGVGQEVTILHTGNPDDPERESWKTWYAKEMQARLLFLDEVDPEPREPILLPSPRHTISHQVFRWLREQDFTAIHFQDWQGNGAISLRAKQTGLAFRDVLLTVTAHGPDEWIREGMNEFPSRGRESLIDDALERTAVELADLLICPTDYMRSWLDRHDWKLPKNAMVLPLLRDDAETGGHDGSLAPGKLREIVFFGRLETRKGLLPFIDAVDQLAGSGRLDNVTVSFLGRHHETTRGGSPEVIQKLSARHEPRLAVRVLPQFDQRQAQAYLSGRTDVLAVVPSLADNSPYTVIECLTRGIPLLASSRGGIPELMTDGTRLVEPTANTLATRLHEMLDQGLNPAEPRHSAAAAAEAWQTVVNRTSDPSPSTAKPTITVVIPHFEQPALLAATLETISRQSRKPDEVIVVDDGSLSANTQQALAELEQKYQVDGWGFLRTENRGPAAARNSGAEAATSDALLFVDSDNMPAPNMVERFATAMATSGAELVTSAFRAVCSGDEEHTEFVFCPIGPYLTLALVENCLGDANFLVRRSLFTAMGGFDVTERSAPEDWQFLLTAIQAGHSLAVVPEPLYHYRIAADSRARETSEFEAAVSALAALETVDSAAVRRLALAARGAFYELRHSVGRRDVVAHQLKILRDELHKQSTHYHRALEAKERQQAKELDDLHHTINDLDHQMRHKAAEIAVHLQKIDTLHRSFSWRVTLPLRVLRRKFLDPRRHTIAPPPSSSEPDEEETRKPRALTDEIPRVSALYKHAVDSPSIWHDLRTRRFPVRGWILRTDHRPIDAVRVRCRSEIYEAAIGRRRTDVFAVAPDHPYASTAGFEVTVRASGAKGEFIFEARTGKGPWECFFHTSWTTTREAQDNPPDAYETWIRTTEDFSVSGLDRLRKETQTWPRRPLISILLPVFNTPVRWLTNAVESVRAQAYENWELCIADDASTAMHVRPILEEYARLDSRIRVVFRDKNGHIAAASNSALAQASGEWTVLFDHDDELAPHALAEVARAILANPAAGIIYSDEDKINEQGHRYAPYFKPEWMPDLLLGQNYISHLAAYPTARLQELGGFREGFEGSQDWDLALRVTETLSAAQIVHIPKILYHWRAIPGSTAVQVAEKDYSVNASERAIKEHLVRTGQNAAVEKVPGQHWRVRRSLPEPAPRVTIVIPTRDMLDVLQPCVESILGKTRYANFEVVIVDNQSAHAETRRWLDEIRGDRVRVLNYPHPFNYSAINNHAAAQSEGDVLAFLNNDLEVMNEEWLEELVVHAVRPEVGCVGAMLYYPDGTVQHAGVLLGVGGVASHAFLRYVRGADGYFNRMRLVQNYSAVTGACLVVRRDTFQRMGGFDEKNLTIAFNDVDLCLRVRETGLRNVWTPYAELVHHESASRGLDDTPEKSQRFAREIEYMRRVWGTELDSDPAYNPHLSLDYPDFSIATPPRMIAG